MECEPEPVAAEAEGATEDEVEELTVGPCGRFAGGHCSVRSTVFPGCL